MTSSKRTFRPLSHFRPATPEWLWEPYIPYSMITILEGDPGLGKTFLSLFIASNMSSGGKLPNGHKLQPAQVAYISYEDDAGYTLRPRGDMMGGDPTRIHVLNDEFMLNDKGFTDLEVLIQRKAIKLVVIDPFVAAIPSNKDMYRSNAIRPILSELKRIAGVRKCAFILVRHLTKTKHDKAIYQGGGSMDYIGAARSAMLVEVHPDDPDKRVMVHIKCNVGPHGQSWVFHLKDRGKGKIPALVWDGESNLRAEDLARYANLDGREPRPVDEAAEFLKRELAQKTRSATELTELARLEGIRARTLTRARKSLGVLATQRMRVWYWSLPKPSNKP